MSEFVCTEIILNSPLRAVFAKMAWQSINLNTNLPLDCHEFARSRFANSRNDEFLVILINSFVLTQSLSYRLVSCHTEALAEVSINTLHCHTELSQESEVSTNSKCKFTF